MAKKGTKMPGMPAMPSMPKPMPMPMKGGK